MWRDDTRRNRKELERIAFYHCDQVGTPQTLSNERGECIWEITQNTWGETLEITANKNQLEQSNIRFQGQYYDEDTGLHYNRYRYYEPYSARYVSKDPIGLDGGLNTTIYVRNTLDDIDPVGLRVITVRPPTQAQQRYASPFGQNMQNSRNPLPTNYPSQRSGGRVNIRDVLNQRNGGKNPTDIYGQPLPEIFIFGNANSRTVYRAVQSNATSELLSSFEAYAYSEGLKFDYLCHYTEITYDKSLCSNKNGCVVHKYEPSMDISFFLPPGKKPPYCVKISQQCRVSNK